ncbi:GNAT family N-acetyltransferase [Kutzneria kofuensis]|uniref:GNAT superfamily N-acetyltransferase n=1 Tax=Kutzneria kofuensis TaxID=103725 RepID=A0A7W9KNU9_9PSEU|nr:GNAT family N-acetyltransferase [Kutzneria kofuensis]MBB5895976.1 GNAT superfamily N-acetyltransferase [Kutzneria kofuensis]
MTLESLLAAHLAYLLSWDPDRPEDSDLAMYRSGVPHWTLNGVVRVRDHDLDDAVAEASSHFAGLPWLWWVGPDSDASVADGLLARGGTELARLPVMTIALDTFVVPDGVSVAEDVAEFVTAYAAVSEIRPEGVPVAVERELSLDVLRFAARVDGRIVGTAEAWISHDVVTVYFVGTQPGFRRQGIGTAVTAAALAAGRERGCRLGALTSSAMGEPVYRRMGFETVAEMRLFSLSA